MKPEKTTILLTEPVFNPDTNRVKMAEILFEKYGFEKMQIGIQALLSLFAEVIHRLFFILTNLLLGVDDKRSS